MAVKERMATAVPWAQSAWDAGEPSRKRRAETNASFFLDSTLFGKLSGRQVRLQDVTRLLTG